MEVLAVDGEPVLAADERETRAEFSHVSCNRSVKACSSARSVGSFGDVQECWSKLLGRGAVPVLVVVEVSSSTASNLTEIRGTRSAPAARNAAATVLVRPGTPQRWFKADLAGTRRSRC